MSRCAIESQQNFNRFGCLIKVGLECVVNVFKLMVQHFIDLIVIQLLQLLQICYDLRCFQSIHDLKLAFACCFRRLSASRLLEPRSVLASSVLSRIRDGWIGFPIPVNNYLQGKLYMLPDFLADFLLVTHLHVSLYQGNKDCACDTGVALLADTKF